jgi:hypothetical protein
MVDLDCRALTLNAFQKWLRCMSYPDQKSFSLGPSGLSEAFHMSEKSLLFPSPDSERWRVIAPRCATCGMSFSFFGPITIER